MPFFIGSKYLYSLWLGQVPPYVEVFTYYMLFDSLIKGFNAGIPELVFATGRIKYYQIVESSLFIISIIVAYLVLRFGFPVTSLFVVYIIFSIIILIVRQYMLNKVVKFDNWRLIKTSYAPSILVTTLALPPIFLQNYFHPILCIVFSEVVVLLLEYSVGLSNSEKVFVKNHINKFIAK